jgi:hypothetical protein
MVSIDQQVHNKFKVFSGELKSDDTIGNLATEIADFANQRRVAAKSIGVEYLETAQRLIISLGYREDEEHYPIKLNSVHLGKIETIGGDFATLEQKMAEASKRFDNIICHELYVTEDHDFMMIFMTHQ